MLTAKGEKIFPNARYILWRDEWTFYSSAERLEFEKQRSQERYDFIQQYFLPLKDKLTLIDESSAEIVPGIRAVYAPGHTKHHIAVMLESEGQRLLYTSDVFIHPLHAENPHWEFGVDLDKQKNVETRRHLLEIAAQPHTRMLGYHFPFPGVGKVTSRDESHYDWQAI